jgi:hypothetical protein
MLGWGLVAKEGTAAVFDGIITGFHKNLPATFIFRVILRRFGTNVPIYTGS